MSGGARHEKRRRAILKTALDVFVDEGFEGTTFQKIADRCGITRTTLYIYFKNKREIFNYSIKLLLASVETDILAIRAEESTNAVDKIVAVLKAIIGHLEENRGIIFVVLGYLLSVTKGPPDPGRRVRRRTIRLRHILSSIVIAGINAGEIRPVSVRAASDFLYGFIESAIFRLAVMRQKNLGDLRETAEAVVRRFAADA